MKNSANEHFPLRCAVHVFLIKNNKLLMLRRNNTGWRDGEYGLPSGHLENNESVISGIIREAKEEAGVVIKEEDLRMVHVMHRRVNYDYLDIYFVSTKWQGEPFIAEKHKANDLQWVDFDKFPENTLENVKKAFENYQKGVIFSQIGWN